ncbi:gliding motility protein GldM [Dokdonia sinensis]|uniref:Gliding motility protein GldM n=1 Tax=Dokdonia sinensis TaxID=2479847 RepID=A0A3M0G2V4_9FLAO|nr:gliding motility protein GldM [Dokdonia sinensis]RMB56532.1 gliding motility protein GldM [Dokdonia sinensis]
MAGGKLSARQKMINLMYLVFIAMLALNMSKEVLSAFGSINEKLTRSNANFESKNDLALAGLRENASANKKAEATAAKAQQAHELSNEYYSYLQSQKDLLLGEVDDPTDYETMDKSNFLDELYYEGGQLTEAGKEYLAQMDKYRTGMLALMDGNNPVLAEQLESDFSTEPITTGEGEGNKTTQDYISYHYVGFPSVSSLTKMTQTQNDIRSVENEYLSKLLAGDLKALTNISEANYETVMTTTKGAYYSSDSFDGIISLGRVDETTKPERVELKIDGRDIREDQYEFKGGRVALKLGAGSVGEHKITGNLVFLQDGEEVIVPVEKSYTTIGKPNSATIAADKMNVVYRGVANPMTIDFAGIDPSKVNASAPGLSKKSGTSYTMNPGTGREVTISVNATLPNGGGPVSDKATFRIKDIPRPVGTVRGDDSGDMKMTREALEQSPVGAALPDFDFDLTLNVSSFKFKVAGAGTVQVNGSRLNAQAKSALQKAKRGSSVQIFDIKASIQGNSNYRLPKVSPVFIELSN